MTRGLTADTRNRNPDPLHAMVEAARLLAGLPRARAISLNPIGLVDLDQRGTVSRRSSPGIFFVPNRYQIGTRGSQGAGGAFRRAFSFSRSFSRLAWSVRRPPYSRFHR